MPFFIRKNKTLVLGLLSIWAMSNQGCKKLVDIPQPTNSITITEAFSNNASATSAITGLYYTLSSTNTGGVQNLGLLPIYTGLSADELNDFSGNPFFQQLQTNTLQPQNYAISDLWTPYYSVIYAANAVIEGLQSSKAVTPTTKNQLLGEAKFIRSFCYFYLINIFGDVPLVISTDWRQSASMARTTVSSVYEQIIQDLLDAQLLLVNDYSTFGGQKVRANKWAATALLARVYLYKSDHPDYANAEKFASSVINSGMYTLLTDLNGVFLANSDEAIWQLQPSSASYPYTTYLGYSLIPDASGTPIFNLTDGFINSLEPGDSRQSSWISTVNYSGTDYYYPFKYKIKEGVAATNPSEYVMVLRLAEQYLIRAEARAQQNNLSGAIDDLNVIRQRAGLSPLSNSLTQSQILASVAQERRVELFTETGDRWLDLKRTGKIDIVLPAIKPQWVSTAKLYPIPLSEIQRDPNLSQNAGY